MSSAADGSILSGGRGIVSIRHPLTWLAAAVVAASAPLTSAQRQTAPPERAADLLAIDFTVVSPDGQPVADLTPDDVTVRIAGRARVVRSLQFVAVAERVDDAVPRPAEPLPPAFDTNATSGDGRAVVLVIDEDSFRPGREAPLRDALDLLVHRLTPHDRLALATVPYGGVKVPFTTDHPRVRMALSRIVGQAPAGETGSQLACRTRDSLNALAGFLDTLGGRAEPSLVLFVTSALAAPRRDAPVSMAPGMCELRPEMFTQVAIAAGAARAQFYVIRPGEVLERYMIQSGQTNQVPLVQRENIAGAGYLGSDNPLEGIEHLAGVTGGRILNLTGTAETAFGRVLRETAGHYVAAVTSERNDRSGRSLELDVRVKRPNVEVRARPQITFAKPDGSAGRATPTSPREMLAVPTVFRDLPLRATGFAALGPDGESLRIVTLVEPVEPGVALASLVAALYNPDGKLVSHWTATPEELQRMPIAGAMPAEPGGYRLRVAAIDTTGRAGTVDSEVNADVARTGSLKLSSVVLGLSRGGTFLPRLQFGAEPVAIAYLEMYGVAAGARVTASLEVASTLNGPPLVSVPLAIEAAGENRYIAKGAVPIGALAPGDYSVRALVALEGHPMTRVVRTLRKAK
jgi:VWFA-related protein